MKKLKIIGKKIFPIIFNFRNFAFCTSVLIQLSDKNGRTTLIVIMVMMVIKVIIVMWK